MRDEAGTKGPPLLRSCEILHRQQRRRRASRQKAGGQTQREAEGGGGVGGRGGGDLVQPVARQAPAQPGVERTRQRERRRALVARAVLDARDRLPQMRYPLGPVGVRHPLVSCS